MIPQPSDIEFLQAIFGEKAPLAHVTSFPDDPSAIVDRGKCWGGGWFKDTHMDPRNNNYFTISIFEQPRRRKDYFIATHLIVADDVAEKIPIENVELLPPPTYKLQSSNGSEQWGWVLDSPCYDRGMVENLLNGLIVQGLAPSGVDPGMKGVTRYIRLPNSKNTKASRVAENGGVPPDVHLTEWNPEIKTSIESLAAPFNIDIHAPVRKESDSKAVDLPDHPIFKYPDIIKIKKRLDPGRHDITCPWVAKHTDAVDDGAAIFINSDGSIGFKCHHGGCDHRTGKDLIKFIGENSPDLKRELRMYEASILFKDIPSLPPDTRSINQPVLLGALPTSDTKNLNFLSYKQMMERQIKTEWVIKDIIDVQSLNLLFGETGSMKSFVAIDMGLCIATGRNWRDHKVKHSGPVFYICGEGFAGISKRLKAWYIKYKISEEDIHFYTSSAAIDLSDPESVRLVTSLIQKMSDEHGQPALVIIDTLNRNFGGGDENSTSDMTRFIQGIDHLKNQLRVAILVIHHTGHGEKQRGRGSSALKAAVDTEYRLDIEGDIRKLTCTKMKDHEPPESMFFRPEVVNLGYIEDEDELKRETSLVMVPTCPQNTESRPKLSNPQKLVLEALQDLCREKPGNKVHIDKWREAAMTKSISESSAISTKRKAFNRAREALISKGYVLTDQDMYWLK